VGQVITDCTNSVKALGGGGGMWCACHGIRARCTPCGPQAKGPQGFAVVCGLGGGGVQLALWATLDRKLGAPVGAVDRQAICDMVLTAQMRTLAHRNHLHLCVAAQHLRGEGVCLGLDGQQVMCRGG
jgi:hypothetical protein